MENLGENALLIKGMAMVEAEEAGISGVQHGQMQLGHMAAGGLGLVNDSFQAMTGNGVDSSGISAAAIPHALNSDPYIESANLVQIPTAFLVLG